MSEQKILPIRLSPPLEGGVHEALYDLIARLADYMEVSARHDICREVIRMVAGFDPLWRQSVAALSVGPSEFGQFMSESARYRIHFVEEIERIVEDRRLSTLIINAFHLTSEDTDKVARLFKDSVIIKVENKE
jgi:hypothetical protein